MANEEFTQEELLGDIESQFKGSEELIELPDRGGIPAGTASVKIENVFLNRSQSKGRLQLVAICTVLEHDTEPDTSGATYRKQWGLETGKNLGWLNSDMASLGLKGVSIQTLKPDLIRLLKELMGIAFKISFVENKDPQYPPNGYINPGARIKPEDVPSGSGSESSF